MQFNTAELQSALPPEIQSIPKDTGAQGGKSPDELHWIHAMNGVAPIFINADSTPLTQEPTPVEPQPTSNAAEKVDINSGAVATELIQGSEQLVPVSPDRIFTFDMRTGVMKQGDAILAVLNSSQSISGTAAVAENVTPLSERKVFTAAYCELEATQNDTTCWLNGGCEGSPTTTRDVLRTLSHTLSALLTFSRSYTVPEFDPRTQNCSVDTTPFTYDVLRAVSDSWHGMQQNKYGKVLDKTEVAGPNGLPGIAVRNLEGERDGIKFNVLAMYRDAYGQVGITNAAMAMVVPENGYLIGDVGCFKPADQPDPLCFVVKHVIRDIYDDQGNVIGHEEVQLWAYLADNNLPANSVLMQVMASGPEANSSHEDTLTMTAMINETEVRAHTLFTGIKVPPNNLLFITQILDYFSFKP